MKRIFLTGAFLLALTAPAAAQVPQPAPAAAPAAAPAPSEAPAPTPTLTPVPTPVVAPAPVLTQAPVAAPAPAAAPGMSGGATAPAPGAITPTATEPAPPAEPGMLTKILANPLAMMVLMFAVIYFMLIRPQSKKRKEHQAWVDNLQRGDTVITQGGLVGKITNVTDRIITLEVAQEVRVRVLRSHVLGPDVAGAGKEEAAAKAPGKDKDKGTSK